MKSANHRWGLPTFIVAIALLSGLFALTMIRVGASNDLTAKNPAVELRLSKTSVTLPCWPSAHSRSGSCPSSTDVQIPVMTMATGLRKDASYSYSVGGGRIAGEGSKVLWDLTGVGPGSYVIKVEVRDSKKRLATSSQTLTISMCGDCMIICELPCPMISVTCYDKVKAGTPITCKVNAQGSSDICNASVGWSPQKSVYKWSAHSSNGEDLSGTITSNGKYVSIPTGGRAGQTVYATVQIEALDPTCNSTASDLTKVGN